MIGKKSNIVQQKCRSEGCVCFFTSKTISPTTTFRKLRFTKGEVRVLWQEQLGLKKSKRFWRRKEKWG